jgi:hypothetical protein
MDWRTRLIQLDVEPQIPQYDQLQNITVYWEIFSTAKTAFRRIINELHELNRSIVKEMWRQLNKYVYWTTEKKNLRKCDETLNIVKLLNIPAT